MFAGGVEGARGGMDKVEYTGPIIIRSPLPDRNFTLKTLKLRIKAGKLFFKFIFFSSTYCDKVHTFMYFFYMICCGDLI